MNSRKPVEVSGRPAKRHAVPGPSASEPAPARSRRESDLEHEGALAAAAGRPWYANPFLIPALQPGATPGSWRAWADQRDAWQRGFEARSAAGGKRALEGALLATLVDRRLRWVPAVREQLARDPWSVLRLSAPQRQERDLLGRNWDLAAFECGPVDETACEATFRTVVDRLRDEFDLL